MSNNINDINLFFRNLYQNFNDRNIGLVIANMDENVQWANGMEGGYVYGHNAVREYWTRQFSMVSANVTPMEIEPGNEIIRIKVHQVVHDMDKNLLGDEVLVHRFHIKEGKVTEFHIEK